ncbi:glycosyl transferase family 90 [Marinomonas sp. 5E14-1]|uniref:glycosyl transferase family 90 n=1 Tax=Marinomonas sp. 5E14-1 TaxID=3153922 RepID=UPI00326742B9
MPGFIVSSAHKKLLLRLEREDKEYIKSRVDYYIKKDVSFVLSDQAVSIKELSPRKVESAYYYDMLEVGRFFPKAKFYYLFGDITYVPDVPSLLKSRPIQNENQNSILLKLNKVRHFNFIEDEMTYGDKVDQIVWRGKSFTTHHRYDVCRKYFNAPNCDIALSNPAKRTYETDFTRGRMSISEQLQNKFILSMEGNDVATNLKWIMSSNSLCFMRQPRYETWFMEGTLIPDFHYVLLKDDFSDLLEKVKFYIENPDLAKEIIANANEYVQQFFDEERERLISLLVMKKYIDLSQ